MMPPTIKPGCTLPDPTRTAATINKMPDTLPATIEGTLDAFTYPITPPTIVRTPKMK